MSYHVILTGKHLILAMSAGKCASIRIGNNLMSYFGHEHYGRTIILSYREIFQTAIHAVTVYAGSENKTLLYGGKEESLPRKHNARIECLYAMHIMNKMGVSNKILL